MSEKREKRKSPAEDPEVEKILDTVWENWSSRRRCEKTHLPDYIKKSEKKT